MLTRRFFSLAIDHMSELSTTDVADDPYWSELEELVTDPELPDNRASRRHPPRKGGNGDRQRRRRMVTLVCEHPDLSDGAKMTVVEMLMIWSDDMAARCWPSQATIAKRRGIHEGTVRRHLRAARECGVLTTVVAPLVREANGTMHRARTNRYTFCVPSAKPNRRSGLNPSSHQPRASARSSGALRAPIDKSLRTSTREVEQFARIPAQAPWHEPCSGTRWLDKPDGTVEPCSCLR